MSEDLNQWLVTRFQKLYDQSEQQQLEIAARDAEIIRLKSGIDRAIRRLCKADKFDDGVSGDVLLDLDDLIRPNHATTR